VTGAPAAAKSVDKVTGCWSVLGQGLGNRLDLITQTYSTTSGIYMNAVYNSGSSSTLGIGFSTSGTYGSYSQSGKTSKSSTATQTFQQKTGAHSWFFDSYFRYGKYVIYCDWGFGSYIDHLEVRPTSYAGGTHYREVGGWTVQSKYCVPESIGASFTKNSTQAQEWSDGLDIDALIGIDLSTVTGYTSSTSVKFSFTANRRLCGYADVPAGPGPRRLEAVA
jgi:hypothetical protein